MGADALKAREALALAAILSLALGLRLIGLRFGLPAVYNPDEVAIMSRSLAFATGDLNPHNFVYPTLYFYLLFGWIGLYGLASLATGRIDSIADLERQFFTDPSGIYVAGRVLAVACGVATVLALYLLARGLFGRQVALVSALFLAVAPTAVRDAHYVKHDVPTTLVIVLALMAITRVWPNPWRQAPPRSRHLVLAALLTGAAVSMHYYAVFLTVPLAAAAWLAFEHDDTAGRLRAIAVAAGGSLLAFLICSPFVLLEWPTAVRDVAANRQIVVDRAREGGRPLFATAGRYLAMLWREGIGWPVILAAVVGCRSMLRMSARTAILLALFPLLFLAFITNTVPASRYLNPVLPFVALYAGFGISALSMRAASARRGGVVLVLALLAALPGLIDSIRTGLFFRESDTRTLAERYITRHVPPGATLLVQPYSVALRPTRSSLIEATEHHLGQLDRASTKVRKQLALDPYPEPAYRLFYLGDGGLDRDRIYVTYAELGGTRGLARLRQLQVRYVVLTRYNQPRSNAGPFLQALAGEARRIAVFSPYRADSAESRSRVPPFLHNTDAGLDEGLERPGPIIEVWRVS
jgi:hypothetical protein